MESILGLFRARNAPYRQLRWHYRSRHHSLIAVSNREFYDDRLVVFPSPGDGDGSGRFGLSLRHLPDTAYGRGGTRANAAEARAVAEAVAEHARTSPDLSLGVAAFSQAQQDAIQTQLERMRPEYPELRQLETRHPQEPFFVKNLENVQGDERDVIFISVGYGRDADGYLSHSFGPLNLDGGERRLNVLISRAKHRCVVFCNFVHHDLDLQRSQSRGVRTLKTFLKYAETRELDTPRPVGGDPESPFEEAVLAALVARGHRVDCQVGSAGFRLDFAIADPDQPGRYLLGLECDGAKYHSARSARDRDRLREQVLVARGWRLHRIWGPTWFRDPEGCLDRIDEAVRAARSQVG
jgi:very-short-patch-repair endonuclease